MRSHRAAPSLSGNLVRYRSTSVDFIDRFLPSLLISIRFLSSIHCMATRSSLKATDLVMDQDLRSSLFQKMHTPLLVMGTYVIGLHHAAIPLWATSRKDHLLQDLLSVRQAGYISSGQDGASGLAAAETVHKLFLCFPETLPRPVPLTHTFQSSAPVSLTSVPIRELP